MHTQTHAHAVTHTRAFLYLNLSRFLWPVVELLPLPVKAGSLSEWSLWPHNNDSWLPEWQRLPPQELQILTEEQDVSQRQLCVTKTGGEEEEEEALCCSLLPELLQTYRKRRPDTSAYLGATRAISWLYVCVCVFGQGKAWQRQKYRWQLGGCGECVCKGVISWQNVSSCLWITTLSFLHEHPAQHILPGYLHDTHFPWKVFLNHQTTVTDSTWETHKNVICVCMQLD